MKPGKARRSVSNVLADRVLREARQLWPGEQFQHLGREIRPNLVRTDGTLFLHFDLLAQSVADALQTFPHRRFIHAGVFRETGRAPAAVISPIAHLAILAGQRQQRASEPAALPLAPARLRLVQDRHFRHVVEPEQGHALGPSHVQGDGHDDPAEPARESSRLVQFREPPESPQVGLLRRILGHRRIAQRSPGDGVRHRLGASHQAAESLDVACAGPEDEIVQIFHVRVQRGCA